MNQYTIEINNQTNTISYIIDALGNIITENSSILLYPEQTIDAVLVSITDIYGCKSIINQANTIIVDQLPVLNMTLNDVCESNPSFILNQGTPQGGTYYINDELANIFDIEKNKKKKFKKIFGCESSKVLDSFLSIKYDFISL